jgi:YHS domain-containing protein
MTVDKSKALTTDYRGQRFHLCSDRCLHTFESDPARYSERLTPLRAPRKLHG